MGVVVVAGLSWRAMRGRVALVADAAGDGLSFPPAPSVQVQGSIQIKLPSFR